jgi:hypothetical protein
MADSGLVYSFIGKSAGHSGSSTHPWMVRARSKVTYEYIPLCPGMLCMLARYEQALGEDEIICKSINISR